MNVMLCAMQEHISIPLVFAQLYIYTYFIDGTSFLSINKASLLNSILY